MRLPSRVIGIAALMLVAGCAEEDTGPNVSGVETIAITSVKIFPSLDTMFIADTISASDRLQLNATAFGRTLTPLQVNRFIWQSSDISVIDVDSAGMVVPVSPGTAVVTASAGKVGRATIVVVPATVTVSITPGIDSILVDDPIVTSKDTVRFAARARDRNGNLVAGVTFSWQATGAAAGVDPSGRASAISLGTGNIAVTAAGHSALASIHVMPLVKSVQLTAPVTQVLAGDTVQLTAQAFDYRDAPIARTFTWTSSAPNVAQVSSTGRVIFSSTGSASFTARTAFRSSQSAVSALPRALLVADAGGDFNCGIAPLGRLYCWGLNHAGQLVPEPGGLDSVCFNDAGARDPGGNYLKPGPSSQCRLAPMQAAQGLEFAAVSAGGAFACGITIDGLLRCWGEGTVGQCGNGKTACGPTAQLATVSTERFASLSAGNTHACALTLAGKAYCWGADSLGQLGDTLKAGPLDASTHSTTPIPVRDRNGNFPTFTAIAAGGRHTCGIQTDGTALCWGDGTLGQRGDAKQTLSDMPVTVSGGLTFRAIAAGGSHTCAITTAGAAYCWGDNANAQLGIGVAGAPVTVPTAVTGNLTFLAIAAGERHTCGIVTGGGVRCWGMNTYGQVGNGIVGGTFTPITDPTAVFGSFTAASITAGRRHTCAVGADAYAYCWGSNIFGALGNNLQAAMRERPDSVAVLR